MDKTKFNEILEGMGAVGPFVQAEVLKGQELLAFAEIPPGDGDQAHQVYVLTKEKLIWLSENQEDGYMTYKCYFLSNMLEYEFGKIPVPEKTAVRAVLKIKFIGNSEIGLETTENSPENISSRHEIIVQGIDNLERQLRKLSKNHRVLTSGNAVRH